MDFNLVKSVNGLLNMALMWFFLRLSYYVEITSAFEGIGNLAVDTVGAENNSGFEAKIR